MREPCPNVLQNFVTTKKHGSLIPDESLVGLIRNEGTLSQCLPEFCEKKHGSLIPDEILVGLIQNEGTPSTVGIMG